MIAARPGIGALRIGTCSWRFPSWAGLVYSAAEGIDDLAEYARRFDCVEIDRWFWSLFGQDKIRLPDPRDAERYRRSVPDGFRFAVKAPNAVTLTHLYRTSKRDPLVANSHFLSPMLFAEALEAMKPLHDLIGPVMLQFEYLNRQKMPSRQAFFEALGGFASQLPEGFRVAVETRNPKYIDASYFCFLEEQKLAPVLISGYWMPPLIELLDAHFDALIRFDTVVLRLMGSDRKAIEERSGGSWDRIVEPKDEELDALAARLHDLTRAIPHPFLFINNHYEGCAPLTIERLRARLGIAAEE
jgi:uncharacterized protein YecE (DUF72 family)